MHLLSSRGRRFLGECLLALLVGWWSVGCVRVEQTLRLNADGSGTLSMRYGMSLSDLADMESMAKAQLAEEGMTNELPANPFEFDEAEVRKDFEDYRSLGVTLEDIRTEVVDGWKYLNLKVAFTSLKGLGQTEFLSDRQVSLKRDSEGRYELIQAAPPGSEMEPQEDMKDLMANMMKGFRAVLRVEVPGDVVESNADQKEARAVVWTFDADQDAQALERAQKIAMRVLFKGDGLSLPEYSSPVVEE